MTVVAREAEIDRVARQAARWLRANAHRAVEVAVVAAMAAVTFAASASHVLTLGHANQVSGWHSWAVAGTVEVLAAYAALECRRRTSWGRILPGLVFLLAAGFLVLANLASVPDTWAGVLLPWAQVYAAVPPVAFLAVALIAETKRWQRAAIRVKAGSRREATKVAHKPTPDAATLLATREATPAVSPQVTTGGTVPLRILSALDKGPMTRADLVAATGAADGTVKKELTALKATGEIEQDPTKAHHWRLHVALKAVAR